MSRQEAYTTTELTAAQRRTLPARTAMAAKFSDPVARSEYFRDLARRSHHERLQLNGDEARVLVSLIEDLLDEGYFGDDTFSRLTMGAIVARWRKAHEP